MNSTSSKRGFTHTHTDVIFIIKLDLENPSTSLRFTMQSRHFKRLLGDNFPWDIEFLNVFWKEVQNIFQSDYLFKYICIVNNFRIWEKRGRMLTSPLNVCYNKSTFPKFRVPLLEGKLPHTLASSGPVHIASVGYKGKGNWSKYTDIHTTCCALSYKAICLWPGDFREHLWNLTG